MIPLLVDVAVGGAVIALPEGRLPLLGLTLALQAGRGLLGAHAALVGTSKINNHI